MTNTPTQDNVLDELVEKLAEIEHERWADWQKWCHQVLRENLCIGETWEHELNLVLERWDRQIATPYSDLSEAEKQSDRDQVARYLPLLQNHINKQVIEARIDEIERLRVGDGFSIDPICDQYLKDRINHLKSKGK